ncbi:MAG: hypothetical protein JNL21_08270 [Myxococcales bacterium]|nr:hypothetical protein [Myxococcales bacterium]
MSGPNLAECAILLATLVAGCAGEPRQRPNAWPALGLYAERPDLEERLAAIDREAAAAGLELIREVELGRDAGGPYVLRSYRGHDLLGRETFACRVASPFGVVLALGPGDRTVPSELVFEADAGEGRLFASPGQLVPGGEPEVLLRRADGGLGVWSLGPRGASPIRVELSPAPSGVRALSTGEIVIVAEVAAPPEPEPLRLLVAAGFAGGAFTTKAAAARHFHEESEAAAQDAPEGETAAARLDRLTAAAFHAIRAGADRKATARSFGQQEVPPQLREVQRARAAWLEKR